jgi:hypothetical protein
MTCVVFTQCGTAVSAGIVKCAPIIVIAGNYDLLSPQVDDPIVTAGREIFLASDAYPLRVPDGVQFLLVMAGVKIPVRG